MESDQSVVLLTVTQEMIEKCPFPEQKCLECLSNACKPDPMADPMGGVDWDDDDFGDDEDIQF